MTKKRRIKPERIIILILIVVLSFSVIGWIINLLTKKHYPEITVVTPEPYVDPVYKHEYDFSKFYFDHYLYYEDDTYTSDVGIDVSYHQADINWQQVKDAGIDFVMIRAGYRGYESGIIHEDERVYSYLKGASEVGLEIGLYFFSQARTVEEAIKEAEYVLHLAKNYTIGAGIAYDMEYVTNHDRIKDLTIEEITANTMAFTNVIREAGYTPIVYDSADWLMNNLYMENLQDNTEFWVASFTTEKEPYPYIYSMWQYSDVGSVPGIYLPVDLNIRIKKK